MNGSVVGSVPAQATRQTTTTAGRATVGWSLVRPTAGSVAVGDPMGGSFGTATNAGQTVTYPVDNDLAGPVFFAPRVTNRSAAALLLGVNMGLRAESRCARTAPPAASRVFLGYYRLLANGNVRAYRSGSGYTGRYAHVDGYGARVPRGSGALELTFTSAP